jgi:hypothetical protein
MVALGLKARPIFSPGLEALGMDVKTPCGLIEVGVGPVQVVGEWNVRVLAGPEWVVRMLIRDWEWLV